MPDIAYILLDRFKVDLEVYTVKWLFSMWSIDLPFDYSMTVLDLYLIDQQ
jgi:hypothetical protein